jgi:flavin reductase (DIM6/NTAB) family NADH-FMN oxidoreductase RutF
VILQIDIETLSPAIQYKLISSTIVPRPIALITTYSAETGHNAAPFSFFNAMGEDPPALVVALENKRESNALKDTTINIQKTGQFVVHMVNEAIVQAMNICAIDFPYGINEIEQAGLTLTASSTVEPKRIVEAPVAMECEKIECVQISPNRHIVIARIRCMHIQDELFDPDTFYINSEKYHPVGRMFGKLYTYTKDRFELTVPSYTEWNQRHHNDKT